MYKGNFHPYRSSPASGVWMAASIPGLEAVSGLAASPDPGAVSDLAASPDPGAASVKLFLAEKFCEKISYIVL